MWRSFGRVCFSQINGYHHAGASSKLLVSASPPSPVSSCPCSSSTSSGTTCSPSASSGRPGRQHLGTADGTTTLRVSANTTTTTTTTSTNETTYGKIHDFMISSKNKDGDDNGTGTTNGNNNNVKNDPSSTTTTATTNNDRDVPRTIIVKRGDLINPSSTTGSPPPPKPTVGKLKVRFPLENQIKDSQGKTMWIPASKMLEYPIVRANALLDSATYVRTGGESMAGTIAARRLLHGKRDLLVLLRYVQRPVLLQGHGIPSQVLEHLVTHAVRLLDSTNNATVLRWVQTNDGSHGDQILAEWCVENLSTLLVDGEEATMSDLYYAAAEELLLLYWTVMDRVVKRLCFKRVPVSWRVEFRRKASTARFALIFDHQLTDAAVTLRGQQVELVFHAFFGKGYGAYSSDAQDSHSGGLDHSLFHACMKDVVARDRTCLTGWSGKDRPAPMRLGWTCCSAFLTPRSLYSRFPLRRYGQTSISMLARSTSTGAALERNLVVDPFCFRQFREKDTSMGYSGTVFDISIEEFERTANERFREGDLRDGYAPFCKHLFLRNDFTDAVVNVLPITAENEGLLRTKYEARIERELPVLVRFFPKDLLDMEALPTAKYLDLILYSREQIRKENSSQGIDRDVEPSQAGVAPPWGIVSIKAQDTDIELPMNPITNMRNALGKEHGGSGVPLDREKYMEAVNYWKDRAVIT